jgi:hypothetical protein
MQRRASGRNWGTGVRPADRQPHSVQAATGRGPTCVRSATKVEQTPTRSAPRLVYRTTAMVACTPEGSSRGLLLME